MGEIEREKRKKREKERKRCQGQLNQSAFSLQKEKLNILAEMLEISKIGLALQIYNRPPSL